MSKCGFSLEKSIGVLLYSFSAMFFVRAVGLSLVSAGASIDSAGLGRDGGKRHGFLEICQ